MVYSTGLATGQLLAATRGVPGERYILCDGHMSFRELAETAVRLAGRGRVPAVMPVPLAKAIAAGGEVDLARRSASRRCCPRASCTSSSGTPARSPARPSASSGWVPTPLEEGLRAVVSAFG